jgi:hypothetical protein
VIFRVVPDEFDVDPLIEETERMLDPLARADSGILFMLPVTRTVGVPGASWSSRRYG